MTLFPPFPVGDPEAAVAQALGLVRAKDYAGAEAALRQVLAADPEHVGALVNLGALLGSLARNDEAAALLGRAAALAPGAAVVQFNHANALRGCGDQEGALAAYRRALAIEPDMAPAWTNLGNALVDLGRVGEAGAAYDRATAIQHASGGAQPLPAALRRTSAGKIAHDIEQLAHLAASGALPAAEAERLLALYRGAAAALPPPGPGGHVVDLPEPWRTRLAPVYNRLVHVAAAPRAAGGAVNPALDTATIEQRYLDQPPGIMVVDDLLTPAALAALRRFCLESTIWFQYRYGNGYLGAFWQSGFWAPLLHQIADELGAAFPRIFGRHSLRKAWAFKYDSRGGGIGIHADFAAVNVNFWLTPDAACLDPQSGGLVVWDKEAPAEWDFATYNADEPRIRAFLAESGARKVEIPHRQNRAVIFNSDLFHETGRLAFRPGYENRRINVTMLFGRRGAAA